MESKPWIDKVVDATNINFNDSSIDVIIASHAIHHFYNPAIFLRECSRVLKRRCYSCFRNLYKFNDETNT